MATNNSSKGKLTNKESGDALAFSVNPTQFRLSRGFDFAIEPCLGQAASVVAYRSGTNATLSFSLRFDKDINESSDPKKVFGFLKGLNKIIDDKKSVSLVEFALGNFNFTGYVTNYTYVPNRFDDKGNATSVVVDVAMLSNGGYESETN